MHHEPAFDGETGMHVGYDGHGVPVYAVKDFVPSSSAPRRNPSSAASSTSPITSSGSSKTATAGSRLSSGEIPAPAASSPGSNATAARSASPSSISPTRRFGKAPTAPATSPTSWACSPHLNAALWDYSNAAQLTAFPMLAVSGIDPKSGTVQVGPGRVVGSADPASSVAFLQPGDLTPLEQVPRNVLGHRGPQHRHAAAPHLRRRLAEWRGHPASQLARHRQGAVPGEDGRAGVATLGHRATEPATPSAGWRWTRDALVTTLFADAGATRTRTPRHGRTSTPPTSQRCSTVTDPVLLAVRPGRRRRGRRRSRSAPRERLAAVQPVATF